MELRQLKSLLALSESGFNVSRAADRLCLVQSAVSQHLARLEEEIGVELFVRRGKRLVSLTGAGERVLGYARAALAATENITAVGRDHVEDVAGVLRIATTHTQARYVLPPLVAAFRDEYPRVALEIHQGTPDALVDMASKGQVDFAITTENLGPKPSPPKSSLVARTCYRWNRSLVVLPDHALARRRPLTLDVIAEYPLVTHVFAFSVGSRLRAGFHRLGLRPHVALGAMDTGVIKTYVRQGLGVGIVASMAREPGVDDDLAFRDLSHLFPWEMTRIVYLRDKYLRRFQQRFMQLLQTRVMDDGSFLLSGDRR